MAWALDTQELYIGNGSVAEGSPSVGNTKILTENDLTSQGNILNLIAHIYKANDTGIQTGPTANSPVSRLVQDRLDDRVSATDFGAVADGVTDDTAAIQRAIDQLFLNPTTVASSNSVDGTRARVILEFGPGIYKTTQTLYIPSYATLVGSGAEKTIIRYTGTGTAIRFVNDNSTVGNPSILGSTQSNSQPRKILVSNLTVYTTTGDQICLQLDAVKESRFENLNITGSWNEVFDADSKGLSLSAVSALVTCENNYFKNITVSGFSYGVWAKQDILNNTFDDCYFYDLRQGAVLGDTADGSTVGEQYGPRGTLLSACKFEDIKRHGVVIARGYNNTTRDSKFTNVGNNGAGVYFPEYPQAYFGSVGNASYGDQSDRQVFLISKAFSVDIELDSPITASQGSLIKQNSTNIRGTLKSDATSDTNITLVTQFLTPYNTTNSLVISDVFNPGDIDVIEIASASSVSDAYTLAPSESTAKMLVGAAITFNAVGGGVTIGTTYYIKQILDSSRFTIVNTYLDAVNPSVTVPRQLNTFNGVLFGSYKPVVTPVTVGPLTMVPYIPEITGSVSYDSYGTQKIVIGYMPSYSLISILPISTGLNGNPSSSVGYEFIYKYKSFANNFTRRGVFSFVVDIDETASTNSTQVQSSDNFDVVGVSEEDALQFEFSVIVLNQYGEEVSGINDIPSSIALRYKNNISSESLSEITYSFKAVH
jgi:hypothetical protein